MSDRIMVMHEGRVDRLPRPRRGRSGQDHGTRGALSGAGIQGGTAMATQNRRPSRSPTRRSRSQAAAAAGSQHPGGADRHRAGLRDPRLDLPVGQSFLVNPQRLTIMILQVSVIGIIAVGVTQVIITGGIDLSSGSVVGADGHGRGELRAVARLCPRGLSGADRPAGRSCRCWSGSAIGAARRARSTAS